MDLGSIKGRPTAHHRIICFGPVLFLAKPILHPPRGTIEEDQKSASSSSQGVNLLDAYGPVEVRSAADGPKAPSMPPPLHVLARALQADYTGARMKGGGKGKSPYHGKIRTGPKSHMRGGIGNPRGMGHLRPPSPPRTGPGPKGGNLNTIERRRKRKEEALAKKAAGFE